MVMILAAVLPPPRIGRTVPRDIPMAMAAPDPMGTIPAPPSSTATHTGRDQVHTTAAGQAHFTATDTVRRTTPGMRARPGARPAPTVPLVCIRRHRAAHRPAPSGRRAAPLEALWPCAGSPWQG